MDGGERGEIRALISGKSDEKTAQPQWHPLARLLEDNECCSPYGNEDIEHLEHRIQIGIERDGEANVLKGMHILRRECAPSGAYGVQVRVAQRETGDMTSQDEERVDEKATRHEPCRERTRAFV